MEDFGWRGTASQGDLAEGPKSHCKVLCRQREGGSWRQGFCKSGRGQDCGEPESLGLQEARRPVVRSPDRPGRKDPQAPGTSGICVGLSSGLS